MEPTPIWLVRHPRVLLPEPTCYGASEIPLEPAHLHVCAQALAQWLPRGCQLLTSQRQRAQALAHALRALRPDLPVPRIDARLNEMDFGYWEMTPWRAIPQAAIDAWVKDFPTHRFGGREAVQDLLERVAELKAAAQIQTAQTQATHSEQAAPPAQLWITHAGVMKAWAFLQHHNRNELRQARQWPIHSPAYGQCLPAWGDPSTQSDK